MRRVSASLALICFCGITHAQLDPWAAPPAYYAQVSGTGQTLAATLSAAMSNSHIQRQYGDFRYSAALHDADPNTPGNIRLVYNNATVPATWDAGITWNREHVWPQSRQPGSVSNSTRGNLGDPHALRPSTPSVNSSRGNGPFGLAATTGSFRSLGTYYFPGDLDKGDIARSLFYSQVRWGPTLGISLVDGVPGTNQMGSLSDLVTWHFLDIPDEFERRRNHVIFSQSHNPQYYTNNRNAFVDLPGAVWSVFVDQFNDSQLFVGSAPSPDGSSEISVDYGRVLVGTPLDMEPLLIHRLGLDGTYFAVTTTGDATTNAPLTNGFTDAFPIGAAPSHMVLVGLDPDALTSPGSRSGQIIISNLDMTLQGGAGRGGNDADDTVHISAELLYPGAASLNASTLVGSLVLDLGLANQTENRPIPATLFNLGTPASAAPVHIEIQSVSGDHDMIELNLDPVLIDPAQSHPLTVNLSGEGPAQATYTLSVSDDPSVFGAMQRQPLTITLAAQITPPSCLGDIADDFGFTTSEGGGPDGLVDFGDFVALLGLIGPCPGNQPGCTGDIADDFGFTTLDGGGPDGVVDFGDFVALLGLIGPCQ